VRSHHSYTWVAVVRKARRVNECQLRAIRRSGAIRHAGACETTPGGHRASSGRDTRRVGSPPRRRLLQYLGAGSFLRFALIPSPSNHQLSPLPRHPRPAALPGGLGTEEIGHDGNGRERESASHARAVRGRSSSESDKVGVGSIEEKRGIEELWE
jgi:hypothetical protein